MTNNDINAWSGFRPVAPQSVDTWDEHLRDFGDENFSVQSPFGSYYQDTGPQAQGVDVPKPAYSIAQQPQYIHYRRVTPQVHQDPAPNMNCFDKPSPTLGNEYSTWNMGHGRGSFAEFSGMQNMLKDFAYQPLMEPVVSPFSTMGPSSLLQSSYLEDASVLGTGISMDKTSPSTVYSGRSTSSRSIDPRSLSRYGISNSTSSTSSWWLESSRASSNWVQNHDMPSGHDGLPRYQISSQPEQFNDPWAMGSSISTTWPSHEMESDTISPKVLSLNISSTPFSICESIQGSVLQISDSSSSESSEDDQSNHSSPESLAIMESQPRRPRQFLPNAVAMSRKILPIIPSNDIPSSNTAKKQPTRSAVTSKSSSRKKSSPPPNNLSYNHSDLPRSSVHKRIEPKPVEQLEQTTFGSSAAAKVTHYRDAKDEFLVRSKLAGMSYKDICKKGKFTEAESTLRGRFRTLTKHKTARVRKPEWNDNDIRLLKKAVRKLTKDADISKCKVPWKQVAEYISENGGSYHFGNATCRKKWDELQAES